MQINATYITFAVYLLLMVAVGAFFFRRVKNLDEYLLGGRGVGSWVTALSAQASDMSGWLLMGLPGAVYLSGLGESWIGIGLMFGTLANWLFIAPRLRIYTEKTDSLTLSSFFAARFHDRSNLLRALSAVIILLFFTIYAASGLVAAGKLFDSMFGFDYRTAVLVGAAVILFYTLLGGYLAVCWTDLIQGALMFGALVAVPLAALGSPEQVDFSRVCAERGLRLSLFPDSGAAAFSVVATGLAWGLGYCGQPHILARFMSIKSVRMLPRATVIAMIWVVVSLGSALAIGLLAIPMFEGLDKSDSEKVFIYMIGRLFAPWIGGVLLAAILAAIMSTIDSQLLVASSALTADFYKKILRRRASTRELVNVSRFFVFFITVIACVLALSPSETIFGIVKFAWGGFGAAFGPVIIMALYSRRASWQSALCGMIVGTVVMIGWYVTGLGAFVYEILPGFVANLATIILTNRIFTQKNESVLSTFDAVSAELRRGR